MAFPENTVNDIGIKHIWDKVTAALSGKVDKVSGKGLSTNDYTTAEKDKLAGIESGAQVNAVTSVAGKTGAVTLDKADVGLGNVDNTSDTNKPISTATQNALNNKADNSDVTEVDTSNSTPFLYRQTPYEADGVFLDELVGGSVAFNQLVQNGDFASKTIWQSLGGSYEVANNIATFTCNGDANRQLYQYITVPASHVVYVSCYVKPSVTASIYLRVGSPGGSPIVSCPANTWTKIDGLKTIENADISGGQVEFNIYSTDRRAMVDGTTIQIKEVYLNDLTQLFGSSTIPDAAYTKEQATAGSGIAWLKSHGFFTKNYYPYNTSELISVKTSGKKSVGFNQWDEEWELGTYYLGSKVAGSSNTIRCKNPINVLPNTTYYYRCPWSTDIIEYLDKDGRYLSRRAVSSNTAFTTPSDVYYMVFAVIQTYGTTYNHDICINFSKTEGTPKNGDYVPYEEHTYDISNINLRGIPKLVNNELVYDGDTYESDGNVTRKYGIVDLGSLAWYRSTSYTNPFFYANVNDIKVDGNAIIAIYRKITNQKPNEFGANALNKDFCISSNSIQIFVRDDSYTDATAFKSAMSGVYLIYELSTPTTETAEPYQNLQIYDKDGTEEFIDDRTVPIPVGHNSRYADLPAIMDGDYLNYMAKNFASEEYVDTKLDTKVDKITGKGLSTNDYTNEEKAFVATIPNKADADDVKGTQTVSGNPITLTDCAPINAESLVVELEPKQDLHGYDFPWVGGAGKNKLPMTVDGIKAANTHGTWSGNAFTWNGIVYTILTDGGNNVIGIDIDGTLSGGSASRLVIGKNITLSGNYLITGGKSTNQYIQITNAAEDAQITTNEGGETSLSNFDNYVARIIIKENVSHSIFYPMIRLATESDPTFAPYSNICPITGYDECEVKNVGKNLFGGEALADAIVDKVSGAVKDTANKTIQFTAQNVAGVILFDKFKENTRYTVILKGINANSATTVTNLEFVYSDGTDYPISFSTAGQVSYAVATSNASKNLVAISGVWNSISTTLYYDECGVFEGVLTAQDYEPYQSTSATIQFGQTVYGGKSDFVEGGTDDEFENLDDFTDVVFHANQGGTYAYEVYIGTPNKKYGVDNLIANEMSVKTSFTDVAEFSIRGFGNDSDIAIKFPKSIVNTPELAKQWCIDNGLQIVYEKATPTTISTPPSPLKLLKGTNNLSADGVMQIGYQPDNVIGEVKGEIDKINFSEIVKYTISGNTAELIPLVIDGTAHNDIPIVTDITKYRMLCVELVLTPRTEITGVYFSAIAFTDGIYLPSGISVPVYRPSGLFHADVTINPDGNGGFKLSYVAVNQSQSTPPDYYSIRVRAFNQYC